MTRKLRRIALGVAQRIIERAHPVSLGDQALTTNPRARWLAYRTGICKDTGVEAHILVTAGWGLF
jgi:hypothetical protein